MTTEQPVLSTLAAQQAESEAIYDRTVREDITKFLLECPRGIRASAGRLNRAIFVASCLQCIPTTSTGVRQL